MPKFLTLLEDLQSAYRSYAESSAELWSKQADLNESLQDQSLSEIDEGPFDQEDD